MSSERVLQLEWTARQGRDCIAITGWSTNELHQLAETDAGVMRRRLALYPTETLVDPASRPDLPPIAGSFLVEPGCVVFVPRFPFAAGMSYSLVVDLPDCGLPEVWAIKKPALAADAVADVLEIYPTSSAVPLNLLRIYVQFSHPMSEGQAARAIRVRCEDTGESLEDVFLPPEPELWDAGRTRLTMLLDPGRIKRGLVPNLESGYPLAEGMTITVSVDSSFRDARSQPLKTSAQRTYRVGPALRSRVDPACWRLAAPSVRSRSPLIVKFDRPLDHGLLLHTLSVRGPDGVLLDGVAEIGDFELSWSFTPPSPWQSGEHHLLVESRLEDIAGNTPKRVFDRDISRPEDDPLPDGPTSILFACNA